MSHTEAKRMDWRNLLAAILTWCSFSAPASFADEVPAAPEFEPVRKHIQGIIASGRVPSVAVAVVRDGRVAWAEGFGLADLDERRPVTADSIYRLASISKPITATALMILRDRGQIDLDAPVNRYLPAAKLRAYEGSADDITLRRLANHTAGLPVHYNFYYAGAEPLSMDETIRRYGFAATRPGSDWEYSNLAFGVLGYVSEVVSRKPWGVFLNENLFQPLRMTHSGAWLTAEQRLHATSQYAMDAAGRFVRVAHYEFDHPGGSVIWSSANDLAAFARMHLGGGELDGVRVLSADAVREMQRLTGRRTATEGNGVAWAVGQSRGRRTISHSGGMPGVATMLRIFPDHNAATIVLTNGDPSPVTGDVTERIAQVLFLDTAPQATQPDGRGNAANPAAPPAPPIGDWHGRLAHFDGDVAVQLEIKDAATVLVKFGTGASRPLQDAVAAGDRVRGRIETRLATQAGFHGTPMLEFRLRRDGARMIGIAVAQAGGYFALSHWVELKRVGDEPRAADPARSSVAPPAQASRPFDLVLRGGRIVDGCGTPAYLADLALRDGRIAAIGRLDGAAARRTIDCTGLIVAPGFIDMMGQTASPFLTDPNAGYNLLTQGITTINCGEGVSAAPLGAAAAARAGWRTMAEYFNRLEQSGLPINMVQTVGHTQVRLVVIGDVDRAATPAELDEMKALVREAMDAGAIGLSTALIYPPAVYASTDEIVELARVAGRHGGRYFTHMRNEGDRLLEAIDEAIGIGRAAGTPVHIFHLKTAGRANWPKMDLAIARIRDARGAGLDVAADIYPYINNGLGLRAFIHPRHSADGPAELLKKLDDPTTRATIRREMESDRGWENWFQHIGADWNNVVLSGMKLDPYAAHNGKSLGEIARKLGHDPWDVFFAVARGDCFALPQSMSEENKIRAMTQEFISFDTDVGPAAGSVIATHPRAYGAFPRVLARYVRDKKVLSLEQAINRMTAVAANELMLYDRGRVATGLAADLVVFDSAGIQDHATLAEPNIPSTGVRYLVVNGELVLEDDKYTGSRPGRVLRRSQTP